MDLDELKAALARRREWGWTVPGLDAVAVEDGRVVIRVDVTLDLVNASKKLHGGAAATLVDIVGTLAIVNADRDHRFGVSVDLNVTWLAPIPLGDTAIVDARVLKAGRTTAFVAVDIRRASDDALCIQGRMTKSMGPPRS